MKQAIGNIFGWFQTDNKTGAQTVSMIAIKSAVLCFVASMIALVIRGPILGTVLDASWITFTLALGGFGIGGHYGRRLYNRWRPQTEADVPPQPHVFSPSARIESLAAEPAEFEITTTLGPSRKKGRKKSTGRRS